MEFKDWLKNNTKVLGCNDKVDWKSWPKDMGYNIECGWVSVKDLGEFAWGNHLEQRSRFRKPIPKPLEEVLQDSPFYKIAEACLGEKEVKKRLKVF